MEFAYLFGSMAKGRAREASDVDVAVHLRGGGSPSERLDRGLELEGRLEAGLGRTLQVVVLNDAPLELRFNVLHHGIPLQARDKGARTWFFVDTGRRYYDMAPARELFRNLEICIQACIDAGSGTMTPPGAAAQAIRCGRMMSSCARGIRA